MLAPAANLRQASRLAPLGRESDRISAAEVGVLLACGALAALAVCLIHIKVSIPGHAILRAALPIAAGFALVPRRSAGIVMTAGAIATTALLRLGNFGEIQSAAFVSLVALGPLLDLALSGAPVGWKLYARFAAAGAAANLLAFATRFALALMFRSGGGGGGMGTGGGNGMGGGFGAGLGGGHDFLSFWPFALLTFAACGAIAGLASAAACFRWNSSDAA